MPPHPDDTPLRGFTTCKVPKRLRPNSPNPIHHPNHPNSPSAFSNPEMSLKSIFDSNADEPENGFRFQGGMSLKVGGMETTCCCEILSSLFLISSRRRRRDLVLVFQGEQSSSSRAAGGKVGN